MAFAPELSTATIAWVPSTLGAQPAITPSSVAKMKRLPPGAPPFKLTGKLVAALTGLNTMPVGLPPVFALGVGICTTSDSGVPLPLYNVEVPLPLLATHTGPVGLKAIPQALTRF